MDTQTRHMPGRTALIAIGSLLVAAAIGIALFGTNSIAEYADGTPEAAAQAYVQALFDGDPATAYELLGDRLQVDCEPFQLNDGIVDRLDRTARFTDVAVADGQATITVRISSSDLEFDPFPAGGFETDTRLVLDLVDGAWRIVDAEWPLYGCTWR